MTNGTMMMYRVLFWGPTAVPMTAKAIRNPLRTEKNAAEAPW